MTSNYDACIFFKNPVAQRQAAFAAPVTQTTDLRTYQTYAVPIKGLDTSGFLSNASFRVFPSGAQRITRAANGSWRYPYSNCSGGGCTRDNIHRVSQLMAYYWLGYQVEEMERATGAYFAKNRNITVDAFVAAYPNAHWDFTQNEIVMGEINSQDLALSAEIYLHEAGHANVHFATMSAVNGASPNDVACGGGGFDRCCSTFRGCIGAINEGQADYHAAMLFPTSTALGEALENDTDGFSECGLVRSVSANQNLLANNAYNACPAALRGEIHVTGRIYASIWFELRRAAGSAGAGQIDTLFTEHLRTLAASDTFETAGTKMIATDNTLFGGSHVAAIRAEFTRRGLTVP